MSTNKSKPHPNNEASLFMQSPLPPESPRGEKLSAYEETVYRFVDNISTVRYCAQTYIPISIEITRKTHKELFAATGSLKSLFTGNAPQLKMGEAVQSLKTIEKFRRYKTLDRQDSLARSFFLSLFSFFDAFTGDLLSAIYRQRPELLESDDKTLTLAEIMRHGSIDDLKQQVIQKEIEQFRRESYIEQFNLFENRFGIKTLRQFKGWPSFVECSQRRNLLTHCDGMVSDQYLQICQREKCLAMLAPKLGERLPLPSNYFYESIDVVHEVGFKLAQTLWRHLVPEQLEVAESILDEHMQNLLNQERWELAEIVGKFGLEQRRFSSDARRRMIQLRYAQSLKWGGKEEAGKGVDQQRRLDFLRA